jgi:hypothetical protein
VVLVILRCTKKVLDIIKPASLADDAASDEDWYANLGASRVQERASNSQARPRATGRSTALRTYPSGKEELARQILSV